MTTNQTDPNTAPERGGEQEFTVEYTKSGVPKNCRGCGHAFHPGGNCREAGRCPCEHSMAIELPSLDTQRGGGEFRFHAEEPADSKQTERWSAELVASARRGVDGGEACRWWPAQCQCSTALIDAEQERAQWEAAARGHDAANQAYSATLAQAEGENTRLREQLAAVEHERGTIAVEMMTARTERDRLREQCEAMRAVVEAAREVVGGRTYLLPTYLRPLSQVLAALEALGGGQG